MMKLLERLEQNAKDKKKQKEEDANLED